MQLDDVKKRATETANNVKKWTIRTVLLAIVLTLVGVPLYTYARLKFTFSTGQRDGYVNKLSKKGWLCKTNEGELSIVNLPGQASKEFVFTVPDDAVAAQIEAAHNHKVELIYDEHPGVPFSCFGETQYFVTGVKNLE